MADLKNIILALLSFSITLSSVVIAQEIFHTHDDNISYKDDKCAYDANAAMAALQTLGQNWGYGYDSLLVDLDEWKDSPYVTLDSLGATVQNRAIWRMVITDPNSTVSPKLTISVHARTHPNEVQAWWVTDEMLKILLSETDPLGDFLRKHCTFHVIPMFNPDGVELQFPRENANGIDIESGWDDNVLQPEVVVLKNHFTNLMASPEPIKVALNMHSSFRCTRYFVYHHQNGTSPLFTQLEKQYIANVQFHFPGGIEDWDHFVSWTTGTPDQYPESWFWLNHQEAVMALTYEDYNCPNASDFDKTAFALLHGTADFLNLVVTEIIDENAQSVNENVVLSQNFPNPIQLGKSATGGTFFTYNLKNSQQISLILYDVLGREVAVLDNGFKNSGTQRVFFNAQSLPAGTYFYRLTTETDVKVNRLLIVK